MKKQERIALKEKIENNFINDFGLEYFSQEEKEKTIKAAFISDSMQIDTPAFSMYDLSTLKAFTLSSMWTQNFHILKAINENNKKLDTLIEQNKTLIALLSKDK